MPATLPTGPLVFCFTDIEGSTRLVLDLGTDRWEPLLARHRGLLRSAIAPHRGHEVLTEGDGFFLVFADPVAAVSAVADVQRSIATEAWPAGSPIRVRVGLHLGEGRLDADGSYVGGDVHRAARIAAAGHGGQIVCSGELAAAVAGRLPGGLELRSQGEHRLKDLRPEPLWDVVIAGLASDFPPIRSLDARPNNLPVQLTSFVGRERELAAALELLDRSRLVTLTGPGGTGKTRLALHVAANAAERFPDGVWFVPLDSVVDPSHVLPAIATVLRLRERPGVAHAALIVEALAGRRVLLVLDNLEQVLAAGPSIAALLRDLPQLHFLATSRAVLRVSGEQELPVPGLPVPELADQRAVAHGGSGRPQAVDELLAFDAIGLFVARAQAARPGFELTPDNAAAVAAICARLSGMPLAIELAAARVRVLPPATILERLSRTLDLLTGGARDLPARQQSLRGAITWSFEVLDEACRRLLERLAVFAGGAALEDAEAVCGPADELGQEVIDGLASLVEQSLIRVDGDSSGAGSLGPRYSLLVPIREFALERLEARGEANAVRRRHATRFLELVELAAPNLTGPDRGRWLDRLDVELENLRGALDHLIAMGDAAGAWRFVAAAWRFWQIRGHMAEEIGRVNAALALPAAEADQELRLRAVSALGGLWWWMGDHDASAAAYREVLDARRAQGDDAAIAAALFDYGFPREFTNPDEAMAAFEEARARYARLGDADGEARAWWGIANASWVRGETERSREAARRAAGHFRAAGLPFDLAWSLFTLGTVAISLREFEEAHASLVDALSLFAEVDDLSGAALTLDALSLAAWLQGDRMRAARLAGAVARLERSTGFGLNPANRAVHGYVPGALRDDPATAPAWADGDAMDLARVIELARDAPPLGAGSAMS